MNKEERDDYMNYDVYNEVINGSDTYKKIAKDLLDTGKCIIGWTDQRYDHRDILFTFRPKAYGNLQRGLRWCYLFISIIDYTSFGFLIEMRTNNKKDKGYIMEKLRLHDNECDYKICELVNGVIGELDYLESIGEV